jgi:hypothetical protein
MTITTTKAASPSTIMLMLQSAAWRRFRCEVVKIVIVLLCLELLLRLRPIHKALSTTLDPYETALWYSAALPVYEKELQGGYDYTIWMIGSSYLMSGLNLTLVEDQL